MKKICGIVSTNSNNNHILSKSMQKMFNSLASGYSGIIKYSDTSVSLGFKISHFSSRFNQTQKKGRFHAVFDGIVYNSSGIKKTLEKKGHKFYSNDIEEIITCLYEEQKEKCINSLDGVFSFALWDKLEKKLFIARDRLGVKPLYYSHIKDKGIFIFASELKCFFPLSYFSKNIDYESLDKYLTFEYIPYRKTIFKNAKKVLPGHFLNFQNNEITEKKYWDVKSSCFTGCNFREKQKELFHLLDSSVKKRLDSLSVPGLFSSGGIDSSSAGFFMLKYLKKLNTFSVAFKEQSFDESRFSRLFSDSFNTLHEEKVFTLRSFKEVFKKTMGIMDEPFADASVFPTVFLSEFSSKKTNTVFSGEGSDEIFLGYPTYFSHQIANICSKYSGLFNFSFLNKTAQKIPVSFKNLSFDYKIKKFFSALEFSPFKRNIIWLGAFNPLEKQKLYAKNGILGKENFKTFEIVDEILKNCCLKSFLDKMQYLDIKTYLEGDLMVKSRIAGSAGCQEIKMPFLDYKIVEFAFSMPVYMKLKGFNGKYILKKTMQKHLPRKIIQRNKKGFGIPVSFWINSGLRKDFDALTNNSAIGDSGLFNVDYIKKILEEHRTLKKDNRKQLWCLYMLENWLITHG